MPRAVHTPDTPLATQCVTPVTIPNAIPAAPEQIQRYLRRKPIERVPNERSINPGKVDYSEYPATGLTTGKHPGCGNEPVHPEGAPYFFNPYKQVFTDVELTGPNLVEIDQCIKFLREEENRVVSRTTRNTDATRNTTRSRRR
ncbi:hypothetical protein J3R82DRAFT_3268 [Butyriboletus roseoflavus]|nr:hypothetical protein J3R82DRAFT_3268 [Butyriboletus roseoflavus]